MAADVDQRSTPAAPAAIPPRDVGRRLFAAYRRALRAQAQAELHRRPPEGFRRERVELWAELVRLGDETRQANSMNADPILAGDVHWSGCPTTWTPSRSCRSTCGPAGGARGSVGRRGLAQVAAITRWRRDVGAMRRDLRRQAPRPAILGPRQTLAVFG